MPDPTLRKADWNLEVVRGAVAGRVYPLEGDELTLGNGQANLNLADQEGASPRKMAAHHVALARSDAKTWTVRDLDTPGGTFVNNKRVMAGVTQPLSEGDVIQLGSVQLRLVVKGATAPRPASSFAYRSSLSGTTCRTWDDFLAFSSQKWDELRDDLTSGRLAECLDSAGHSELAPPRSKTRPTTEQADEQLDAWLGRLPTRSPSKPELDVHPLEIRVSVPSGGVTVRRKVRVSNVGHRLLRARVIVEASRVGFTLAPGFEGRELVIRDSLEVPFELAVPDPLPDPFVAELLVIAGEDQKRVVIRVDRKANPAPTGLEAEGSTPDPSPVAAFWSMPVGKRVVLGGLVAGATRLLVGVAGGAIGEDAMLASGADVPRLGGVVVALGLLGACGVGWWMRRGGRADATSGAVAGAGLGALGASVIVAACRAIEPMFGSIAASPIAVCILWAGLGAMIALWPTTTQAEEPVR